MSTLKKAAVVVADPEPASRSGLIHLIDSHPQFRVCGEADNLPQARQLCAQHKPPLLLMDLMLGDGFSLIKDLARLSHQTRAVVFTAQIDVLSVQQALQVGAYAVLARRDPLTELVTALLGALEGARHLGPHVEQKLLERVACRTVELHSETAGRLSIRELQVFRLMGAGQSTHEVAANLGISMKTIATHQQRMKLKLGLRTGAELQRQAILSHADDSGCATGSNGRAGKVPG